MAETNKEKVQSQKKVNIVFMRKGTKKVVSTSYSVLADDADAYAANVQKKLKTTLKIDTSYEIKPIR